METTRLEKDDVAARQLSEAYVIAKRIHAGEAPDLDQINQLAENVVLYAESRGLRF